MALRPKFDPEPHGLDSNFRLTKFTGDYIAYYAYTLLVEIPESFNIQNKIQFTT